MAKGNAQEVAAKWASRTANAVSDYKAGVMAVKEAPGAAAARQVGRMIDRLQQMAASGELQAAMQSVSLADWQRATAEKGGERLASGARQSQGKMQQFLTEFLPYVQSVKESLPSRGTPEENIERMLQNVRQLSKFKKRR